MRKKLLTADKQLGLFCDLTPVSLNEVYVWLERVPRIDCTSPRARTYYRSFRVLDKIRAHKERGEYMTAIGLMESDVMPQSLHKLSYSERVHFFEYSSEHDEHKRLVD